MGRWLVILSLAVVQRPDIAMASPKSPDLPLWKRLLSTITPKPTSPRRHQARPVKAVAMPNSPGPAAEWQVHEPAKSATADTSCNGGRRLILAFYWQGGRTASGEGFDPKRMTAAHRTLPFCTPPTLTNPRTGKSVTVVVNDRGPFVSGVSLDLSLGAAQAIGMRGTGAVCIW